MYNKMWVFKMWIFVYYTCIKFILKSKYRWLLQPALTGVCTCSYHWQFMSCPRERRHKSDKDWQPIKRGKSQKRRYHVVIVNVRWWKILKPDWILRKHNFLVTGSSLSALLSKYSYTQSVNNMNRLARSKRWSGWWAASEYLLTSCTVSLEVIIYSQ